MVIFHNYVSLPEGTKIDQSISGPTCAQSLPFLNLWPMMVWIEIQQLKCWLATFPNKSPKICPAIYYSHHISHNYNPS